MEESSTFAGVGPGLPKEKFTISKHNSTFSSIEECSFSSANFLQLLERSSENGGRKTCFAPRRQATAN